MNLRKAGLTQQQARQLYTAAQRELPRLRDIQSRQDSGEQQLTIEEFTQAVVFQDPDQLENIRRLEAEEKGEDVSIEDIKEVEETASEEDTGSTNT